MSKTNRQTLEAYEHKSQAYVDATPHEVEGHVKEWIDFNLDKLKKDARILEVGSGFGRDADYMEARGFRVERSDAAKSFVSLLQEQGHEARQLNIISDPIPYGYHMIFADAVLLHLTRDELQAAARKIYAALAADGRFVLSLKRGDGEETTDRKLGMPRYFCYWQPEAIETLLLQAGFATVKDTIAADRRGDDRPEWLMLSATKGSDV